MGLMGLQVAAMHQWVLREVRHLVEGEEEGPVWLKENLQRQMESKVNSKKRDFLPQMPKSYQNLGLGMPKQV